MRKRLLCIAPDLFNTEIEQAYAEMGVEVLFHPRYKASDTLKNDPFAVATILKSITESYDAVLLISPKRRAPAKVLPSSIIEDTPCGLMFADSIEDLIPWLETLSHQYTTPVWGSLNALNEYYVKGGAEFVKCFKAAGRATIDNMSEDKVVRSEVIDYIATGPQLLTYVGHGTTDGFCGYFGIDWDDIREVETYSPCGTIMSFSCSTVSNNSDGPSFGQLWVSGGRAAAFVGSIRPVKVDLNYMISSQTRSCIASSTTLTIGELLLHTYGKLLGDAKLKRGIPTFNSYRIIGNPLQVF